MRLRYTRRVRADLEAIFAYLTEHSPQAADTVKRRIAIAIWRLSEHPLIAPEADEPGVRELSIVRYPYKVYYAVTGDEVAILHVRHTSRRPRR